MQPNGKLTQTQAMDIISKSSLVKNEKLETELLTEYMKTSIDKTKSEPNPNGFADFVKEKMKDETLSPKEQVELTIVSGRIERERAHFERSERAMYEEWLVGTLNRKDNLNKDNYEYGRAVEHLKYREAGDLQYRVERDEHGKPNGIGFRIKVHEEEVAKKHGAEGSNQVEIQNIENKNENLQQVSSGDLAQMGTGEYNQWTQIGNNGNEIRNVLWGLREAEQKQKGAQVKSSS